MHKCVFKFFLIDFLDIKLAIRPLSIKRVDMEYTGDLIRYTYKVIPYIQVTQALTSTELEELKEKKKIGSFTPPSDQESSSLLSACGLSYPYS